MIYYGKELFHHGILGQKWGIRKYQNPDGSLTPAGRERYLKDKLRRGHKDIESFEPFMKTGIVSKKGKTIMSAKEVNEIVDALKKVEDKQRQKYEKKWDKAVERSKETPEQKKERYKKYLNVGARVATGALTGYLIGKTISNLYEYNALINLGKQITAVSDHLQNLDVNQLAYFDDTYLIKHLNRY